VPELSAVSDAIAQSLPWNGWQLTVVFLVMTAAGVVQGTVGFGLNLLAAPILTLIDPSFVPGPAIAAGLVHTILMLAADRRAVIVSDLGWATGGRFVGSIAGAATLTVLAGSGAKIAFGVLVLIAAALSGAGLRLTPNRPTLIAAGCLSGLMGTMTSVGGPPMALVYQHHRGAALRGALAGQFVIGAAISLVALAAFGRFGRGDLAATSVLIPGVVLGWSLSRRLVHRVDRGYTRPAILALAAGAAIAVIVREL
jgi:uncharacterized membrane protein YfcA